MSVGPIRVILVDDSALALAVLQRILAASPDVEVVGTARNGAEALELIPRLEPTVLCTDLHMPVMDGLELTRQVMARFPRPILVVSSTVRPGEPASAYPVLAAGALDVFPKPAGESGEALERLTRELVGKIRVLAGVRVFTRKATVEIAEARSAAAPVPTVRPLRRSTAGVVVIGASTGGPIVLRTLLSDLPRDFPVPILCVQHISNGFLGGFVDWLRGQSRLQVKIAAAGEKPQAGCVYFAPEGTHLEIDTQGYLRPSHAPPLRGHRPSITVAMVSAARYYGSTTAGVLLTGMGDDGAEGLLEIARVGGLTFAQDEASCVVFGMPREAVALGAAQHVLPPPEIARHLARLRAAERPGRPA